MLLGAWFCTRRNRKVQSRECSLRVLADISSENISFILSPPQDYFIIILGNLFLHIYYSQHEWCLCLFWIYSFLIAIYDFLVLSSCATLKKGSSCWYYLCYLKFLNTWSRSTWVIFSRLHSCRCSSLSSDFILQPCSIFKCRNIPSVISLVCHSLQREPCNQSLIFLHMYSNDLYLFVFEVIFQRLKKSSCIFRVYMSLKCILNFY